MTECNRELIPIFEDFAALAAKHQKMVEGTEAWEEVDRKLAELYNKARSIYERYHKEHREGGYFIKMYNERKEGRNETH